MSLPLSLSWALAALLAMASIIGLAIGMDGMYQLYPASATGLFAQDLVVLFGALPALLLGILLSARGVAFGFLLWSGMLFYTAYTYFFMLVGAVTVLFPVYIAIVAVSTYSLLALLLRLDVARLAERLASAPRRSAAVFFFVIVGLFTVLWGGLVASTLATGEELSPVQHLVVAADGAILLPILAYAGLKLWQGTPGGYVLGGVLLVKTIATGFTLAFTGAFSMLAAGQIEASELFLVVVFSAMAVAASVLLVRYLPRSVPTDRRTNGEAGFASRV
ncbi:MAG: hypothetical protein M3322_03770 [Actinomycetota bacterium]|nr:hypothetical protein [Actinomycetota bacterium]